MGCWGERRDQPAFGWSFDAVLWCGWVTPSTCPTTGYVVLRICYVAVMSEMVVRYSQHCHMRGSNFLVALTLEPGGYPLAGLGLKTWRIQCGNGGDMASPTGLSSDRLATYAPTSTQPFRGPPCGPPPVCTPSILPKLALGGWGSRNDQQHARSCSMGFSLVQERGRKLG